MKAGTRARSRRRSVGGFTLTDVMMGLLVFTAGASVLASGLADMVRLSSRSYDIIAVTTLARNVFESLRRRDPEEYRESGMPSGQWGPLSADGKESPSGKYTLSWNYAYSSRGSGLNLVKIEGAWVDANGQEMTTEFISALRTPRDPRPGQIVGWSVNMSELKHYGTCEVESEDDPGDDDDDDEHWGDDDDDDEHWGDDDDDDDGHGDDDDDDGYGDDDDDDDGYGDDDDDDDGYGDDDDDDDQQGDDDDDDEGGSCMPAVSGTFSWDNTVVVATSTKDLSNVVLNFEDGVQQKYDGLSGKSGTFSGMGCHSRTAIVGVWIKSGCNSSGDGPGYGEYVPNSNY